MIAGLISAALVGLILVQVLLLNQAYRQKLALFRLNAEAALRSLVEKLETLETLNRVLDLRLSPEWDGQIGRAGLNIEEKSEKPPWDSSIRVPADPYLLGLINKVLAQYLNLEKKSISERIPATDMDKIVEVTVRNHKIEMPAAYGILKTDSGDFIRTVPAGYEDRLRSSEFRTRLYPHDLKPKPYDLVLYFPGQKRAFLAGMVLPAAAALVFLLITGGCFVFILSALAGQRRFAARLTDFINNMAHAFKTPLSTLSLAGSALAHEDVRRDDEQLARCGRIVIEESEQLRRQTERILEMTVLEKKDIGLALRPVDIHDLLDRAIERFTPEAEKRRGTIRLIRGAPATDLEADETHWQGALDNLLDNAFRYNRRPPEILIETSGTDRILRMVIRDNGIGIPARDLSHVFDKYFRVARGLRQEAPGFGLGLSYVRWVVEAHGGTVRARSRIDEGSEFELTLPLRKGAIRKRRRARGILRP